MAKFGGAVDLSEWYLQTTHRLDEEAEKMSAEVSEVTERLANFAARLAEQAKASVLEAAGEVITAALADDQTLISLVTSGPDPLTLRLSLALNGDDDGPSIDASLRDEVRGWIDDYRADEDGIRDDLQRVRTALRELADEIDAALARHPGAEE